MIEQFALWAPETAAAEDLRPIHYLGNKLRLLDVIEEVVGDVDSRCGPALDLFSGSGVVARRLSRTREVLAVDIQEYARVLAAALLTQQRLAQSRSEAMLDKACEWAKEMLQGPLRGLVAFERRDCGVPRRRSDQPCDAGRTRLDPRATHQPDVPAELGELLADAAASTPSGPETVLTRYYGGVYFSTRTPPCSTAWQKHHEASPERSVIKRWRPCSARQAMSCAVSGITSLSQFDRERPTAR